MVAGIRRLRQATYGRTDQQSRALWEVAFPSTPVPAMFHLSYRPMSAPMLSRLVALASLLGAATTLCAQPDPTPASGDSVGRRRIRVLPALASAPETGLQFGATVLAVWEPAARLRARPASLTATALRTTKSQTRLRIDGERWSTGNARRFAGTLQWQEFPLPYFGIGDRTPESAEELYVPRGTEAILTVQQRFVGAWYATAGLRYLDQRITPDSVGVLRTNVVTGSRGGAMSQFIVGVLNDTRDNLFAPHTGRLVQLSYARSDEAIWSDFTFGTLRLDARTYNTVRREHVFATQLQVIGVDGAAPFDQLALVGNSDIMRGYVRGRYRDRWAAALQGEYRTPVRRRLGAVVFAGAGMAAPSLDAFGSSRLLPTYGAGLRMEIDPRQRIGVRADYGRGGDGASGIYLGFNQAF